MPITSRGKGYPIPDDPEPEGYYCVRVYVPHDQLYMGVFWQSLNYLASPRAWANDADHTALIAAEVWKAAIQKSQEIDACGEGDCGIMDVRQSDVKCKLDKLDDCSGEWEQFADLRLCVPKMRMVNGVLQQDTTGEGNWVDAGDPEEPYDPRTDNNAPAPWTDPPVGEHGECLSAANVAAYINYVASDAADWMADGLSFFQAVGGAVTILTALIDLIPLTLLTAFITALYTQVIDAWADVRDFDITTKLTELMICKYNADGSMTKGQWIALMAECNAWRDTLTDNDERAKWWIAIQLMNLWGNVGMTISGQIWGITTYECDPGLCTCDMSIEYDFTTSDEGWATFPSPNWPAMGTWVSGDGWRCDTTGTGLNILNIRCPELPEGTKICRVDVKGRAWDGGIYHHTEVAFDDDWVDSIAYDDDFADYETKWQEAPSLPDYETQRIQIFLRQNYGVNLGWILAAKIYTRQT